MKFINKKIIILENVFILSFKENGDNDGDGLSMVCSLVGRDIQSPVILDDDSPDEMKRSYK